MDREVLIQEMMRHGHSRTTAEGAIAGRGIEDLWREYMGGTPGGGGTEGDYASIDETSPSVVRETISRTYLVDHDYHDPGENSPTHRMILQFKSSDGTTTAYCYRVNMGFVKLGG